MERPPTDPDCGAIIGRESDLLGAGFSAAPLTKVRILKQTLADRRPVAYHFDFLGQSLSVPGHIAA